MYSRQYKNRNYTTVAIMGIDIWIIDILRVDIPTPTAQNNLKTNANANALFCQIMPMHCFMNQLMPMLMPMLQISFYANDNALLC